MGLKKNVQQVRDLLRTARADRGRVDRMVRRRPWVRSRPSSRSSMRAAPPGHSTISEVGEAGADGADEQRRTEQRADVDWLQRPRGGHGPARTDGRKLPALTGKRQKAWSELHRRGGVWVGRGGDAAARRGSRRCSISASMTRKPTLDRLEKRLDLEDGRRRRRC